MRESSTSLQIGKCLFETRGESLCSETTFTLTKRSECRSSIDEQLRRWHLSQRIGSVQEQELILNRSGLPHDLASKQLERLWICAKHRHHEKLTSVSDMPIPVASWPEEGTYFRHPRTTSFEKTKLVSPTIIPIHNVHQGRLNFRLLLKT